MCVHLAILEAESTNQLQRLQYNVHSSPKDLMPNRGLVQCMGFNASRIFVHMYTYRMFVLFYLYVRSS